MRLVHRRLSSMKRNFFIFALLFLATAVFAAAQLQNPTTDVLGAHLNYGRGCAGCHAPHSGVFGNGGTTTDSTTGDLALWGQDVSPLYGQTIVTGNSGRGTYSETLPTSLSATTPDVSGVLMCLSCHDGNLAKGTHMIGHVYETLPGTYGGTKPPTLLGNDGGGTGVSIAYQNDHPVGLNAVMTCGGTYDWDCTISTSGVVEMNGPNSAAFVNNYGFFVSPGAYNNTPVVMCTTCHNQHLMNVVAVKNTVSTTILNGTSLNKSGTSGLPAGNYATMFFIRAPYNPNTTNPNTSNQTAQFCRQCHGGESNEMNGGTAGTTF
jgi:hypothetical protein